MKCPSCETEMLIRDGKFGEFYYCPEQHICKQKTITKKSTNDVVFETNSNELYNLAKSGESNVFSQSLHELHTLAVKEHIDWCLSQYFYED